jgi:hypothetical protein
MITVTSNMQESKTVVHWQVSKFCEKSCHYCTAYDFMKTIKKDDSILHHPKSKIELDDHIAELLPEVVTNGNILLFGGEPTLHPKGIDYFNSLCYNTKDNPDVAVFLVTHGDIDVDKIERLDTHGKPENIVSISYHYYQVNFYEWLEKVKLFNKKSNVLVSAIIPRSKTVWDDFERNILTLFNEGIAVDIKSELDNKTNQPDTVGIQHFKDLYYVGRKTQSDIMKQLDRRTLYISDGKETLTVNATEDALPLQPNNTFCTTTQYTIAEDIFKVSCDQGGTMKLTTNTTADEMKEFAKGSIIPCTKTHCSENRVAFPATIKILNANLKDYQSFVDNQL